MEKLGILLLTLVSILSSQDISSNNSICQGDRITTIISSENFIPQDLFNPDFDTYVYLSRHSNPRNTISSRKNFSNIFALRILSQFNLEMPSVVAKFSPLKNYVSQDADSEINPNSDVYVYLAHHSNHRNVICNRKNFSSENYLSQDAKRGIEELKEELGKDYKVKPTEDIFIVASNAEEDNFERAKSTIKNVYKALYKDFFTKKPSEFLKIYLFKDAKSYSDYVKKIYGKEPSTPFGFYKREDKKLVMDISTGTGTLAHEMVHPFLETDFPDVPPWFNEGFASLFEQSTYKDGSLKGLVNWRLAGLQDALKNDKIVPLKKLFELNEDGFYGKDSGLHYAEARYLCLYLQEKEILGKFYKDFKTAYPKDDKTGQKTIEKVFAKKITEIEKEWKRWASTLKR